MQAQSILQNANYQKFIVKADAEGVYVSARFATKDTDKALGYNVKGSKNDNYSVEIIGGVLKCSCKAGQNGTYCKHRAVCARYEITRHARLEAETVAAKAAPVVSEDRAAYMPAPRDMAAHLYR